MLLKIRQAGEPVLRGAARALSADEIKSPEIQELVERMRATMYDAPGVGLAAPQIGEPLQMLVIEDRAEGLEGASEEELRLRDRAPVPFHALFNPVLAIEDSTVVEFFEGCLSVNGFVALVPRALGVRVEALDHHAEPVTIHARGWYARILQHETDHLQGTLCIDRMEPRSFTTNENHLRYWRSVPIDPVREALGAVPAVDWAPLERSR
jgi:peptide deformylase